jgi:hypothetical protein
MAEKKDVLEYLRNRQKAAEIDAKVNGINLWVLLGALVIVLWHLLGFSDSPVWSEPAILLRTVVAAQAGFLIVWACGSRVQRVEHVRFASWRVTDMDTPFLDIIQGLIVLTPTVLLFLMTRDWSVIVTSVFGLVFLLSGIAAVIRLIRGEDPERERFPEPYFGGSQRSNVISIALFSMAFAGVLVHQINMIRLALPKPLLENAKVLGVIAVFYVLCLLAFRRRAFGESTRWTYELETDLLLESVSTEVALRRIEHRALGPRLQDVMDKFFDGLDKKFAEIEQVQAQCMSQLEEVDQIPKEYGAERNSRVGMAVAPMERLLTEIKQECTDFASYLKRLEEKQKAGAGVAFAVQVAGLRARHSAYVSRAEEVESAIKRARQASNLD